MAEEVIFEADDTVEDADWIKNVPRYCPHCRQRETKKVSTDGNRVRHHCTRCNEFFYTAWPPCTEI